LIFIIKNEKSRIKVLGLLRFARNDVIARRPQADETVRATEGYKKVPRSNMKMNVGKQSKKEAHLSKHF